MIINRFVCNLLKMGASTSNLHTYFTETLMQWHHLSNNRVMPWKFEPDPYKIWLSEIILQQTRVAQGEGYYNRFIKKYPTVEKLANAKEADVFKLWEGLGYYSRCRNLITTAQIIHQQYQNVFPKTFQEILQLKGIGPYTAAAIASFGFNLPHSVVDGNVMRVLSRFFEINTPIDSTEGKKQFSELAQVLLDKKQPAQYNQAIMDFGATVCKPQLPLCTSCPFSKKCSALQKNKVLDLPVKAKKIVVKKRYFNYVLLENNGKVCVMSRSSQDIWRGLNEFFLIETADVQAPEKILKNALLKKIMGNNIEVLNVSKIFKQKLTHQLIEAVFIRVRVKSIPSDSSDLFLSKSQLKRLAFPKIITQFLEETNFMNV